MYRPRNQNQSETSMVMAPAYSVMRPAVRSSQEELSRLLNAAIVSASFCDLLLKSPDRALATGYNYEPFQLSLEERSRVLSIQATSLADFASKLLQDKVGETSA